MAKPAASPISRRSPPSFRGLAPSSARASESLSKAQRSNTRCELMLRRSLWKKGLRYRVDAAWIPGRPDIAFPAHGVAVFCDGDFWHGREWRKTLARLRLGANPNYWTAKIQANRRRDARTNRVLRQRGWKVLRYWESDIIAHADQIANEIAAAVRRAPTEKWRLRAQSRAIVHDLRLSPRCLSNKKVGSI
jgi:DNA mismatch endonuclease (patch repair protein)